jgi:diguanylate cyclase (GGDEF)-like protein
MKILVVEDQKMLGIMLCRTLEKLGHEPRLILSGPAAWEMIDHEDWPLVITDWVMPDLDGLELCRRIRARRGKRYNYVIMLTSRTGRQDRLDGLAAGADDFLTKPVDEDELAIRLVIAGRILAVQAELEEKNSLLNAMASTDTLTGLANRRRLFEVSWGSPVQPWRGGPCSIVTLDIDHFKSYNDSFGHAAGDEVLRTVAAILRAGTRVTDLLVRTGGEEFVVVLPATGHDEALAIANRLRIAIEAHPWPTRPVTASFGVTATDDDAREMSLENLLDQADRALYHSKRTGRNRVTHAVTLEA